MTGSMIDTSIAIETLIDLSKTSGKIDPLVRASVSTPGTALAAISSAGAVTDGRLIALDILLTDGSDADDVLAALADIGMSGVAVMDRVASGWIDADDVSLLESLEVVQFARVVYDAASTGAVGEEGSLALNADAARLEFGVDGSGVAVGVLSDSFDNLGGAGADAASGDLPASVSVLEDAAGSDEGRAMLQIVHDVAPGAELLFHTALGGQANFAQGILDLVAAGADVVVDDIVYLAEPFFQDGLISRAVDAAFEAGAAYFSSAGNSGNSSYEAAFAGSGGDLLLQGSSSIVNFGEMHDFDAGAGVDVRQRVHIPTNSDILITFQWDEPFASVSADGRASASDMDILLFGANGDLVTSNLFALSANFNIGGDPVEVFQFVNTTSNTEFDLVISHFAGPEAGLMKYVELGGATILEHATDSAATFGHAPAEGGMSVGAAFYQNTPNFGATTPILESFSSEGPTTILFDDDGVRLAEAEVRASPDVVGPDGTNNTFFGFDIGADADSDPNFFGTSAAAPHVAAVAALLLEANPDLTPAEIYAALEQTAIDMGAEGFDDESGFGLVDAEAALVAVVPEAPVGTSGDDVLIGTIFDDFIEGLGGKDTIEGRAGDDELNGGSANDNLSGGDGDDLVIGARGNDQLQGDAGDDDLRGGGGRDVISGGDDKDDIRGGAGNDIIRGNDGDDFILGQNGVDMMFGGAGDDELLGGKHDDVIRGDEGADIILGEAGNDRLLGGDGIDEIRGANGDDVIFGDDGDDLLFGGADSDLLDGGLGVDQLTGGNGRDSYLLNDAASQDIILDFAIGADKLVFADGEAATGTVEATTFNGDAAIIVTSGDVSALLVGLGPNVDFDALIIV